MKPLLENSRNVPRRFSRRARFIILIAMAGASGWFFLQLWQNVSFLATRTLPGVAHAAAMIDLAAQLEIARLDGTSSGAVQEAFGRSITDYAETVAVDQDRENLEGVGRAYELYRAAPSRESWRTLQAATRTLHGFRIQRAQTFASDSRDRFTAAIVVNAAGLMAFALLFLVFSVTFALRRQAEDRPDNF